MLNENITELYELRIHKEAFRDYMIDNHIISEDTFNQIEKIENLFFAYNLPIEKIKKLEVQLSIAEYLILFSVNTHTNSFCVRIYGKINHESIESIRENIFAILNEDGFSFYVYDFFKLYDKTDNSSL